MNETRYLLLKYNDISYPLRISCLGKWRSHVIQGYDGTKRIKGYIYRSKVPKEKKRKNGRSFVNANGPLFGSLVEAILHLQFRKRWRQKENI